MTRNSEVFSAMFQSLELHLEAESSRSAGYSVANARSWVGLLREVVLFNGLGAIIITGKAAFNHLNRKEGINAEASRGGQRHGTRGNWSCESREGKTYRCWIANTSPAIAIARSTMVEFGLRTINTVGWIEPETCELWTPNRERNVQSSPA